MLIIYYIYVWYISKIFGVDFCSSAPFLQPHQSTFWGFRRPPRPTRLTFYSFFTPIDQVILVLLMFNWFIGSVVSFWGANFMLTPPNMIESIWEVLYPAKRHVFKSVKGTSNRLNHPKLFQTLRYVTQW